MRKTLYTLAALITTVAIAWAAGTMQTINTLPTSGASFMSQLTTFLRDEDAARYRLMMRGFVVSGGTHATGAGLSHSPASLTAIANGYYVTATGAITYPDASTCYVIADALMTGNLTGYTRVSGTHYLIGCSGTPTTPSTAVSLMTVVTSGGAVTTVTDTRPLTAMNAAQGGTGLSTYTIGDLLYASTTTLLSRLTAGADGNVLRSAGSGTPPLYGKVRLSGATTDITGTLGCANGGSGVATAPTNGQFLIGNGTCFTLASITAGSGISLTPGAGSLTIANTAASTGAWRTVGQLSKNNATFPNNQYDLFAQTVVLRTAADSSIIVRDSGAAITVDVDTAGPAANGRDQAGAFSASSWIHFYWIWNGTLLRGIASATAPSVATGPTLPTGYTHWSYAGAVRYNATPNLVATRINGTRACTDSTAALATGLNATAETAQSVATVVPPNALSYTLHGTARMAANAASDLDIRVVTGVNLLRMFNNYAASVDVVASAVEVPNVGQSFMYIWGIAPSNGLDVYVPCYTNVG